MASNVGLGVLNSSVQMIYSGGIFCGQSVVVGPGATWMHYNINVRDSLDTQFSCESRWGYVPVEVGKVRCQLRNATFVWHEQKGIWAVLTITPA